MPSKSLENAQRAIRTVEHLDCSGYMRLQVYAATGGKVLIPDGSAEQREWMEKEGFSKVTPYANEAGNPETQFLYINFIAPTDAHAGHVWAVQSRETCECHGGSGVGSRLWNTRPLPQEWVAGFVWPHVWQ